MEFREITAKTVDEAITKACLELETSSDNLEIQVVREGTSGFFGIGSKPAIIRVRRKVEEEEFNILEELKKEDLRKESRRTEKERSQKRSSPKGSEEGRKERGSPGTQKGAGAGERQTAEKREKAGSEGRSPEAPGSKRSKKRREEGREKTGGPHRGADRGHEKVRGGISCQSVPCHGSACEYHSGI